MTSEEFRKMALALPGAIEKSHMAHPDFRAGPKGRIFATLWYPDKKWAMVRLTPLQQMQYVEDEPDVFVKIPGAWGQYGATNIRLSKARKTIVGDALRAAWNNATSKKTSKEKGRGAARLPGAVRARSNKKGGR